MEEFTRSSIAKQYAPLNSILVEGVGQVEMQRTIESFMRECRQCSTLRHPNVLLENFLMYSYLYISNVIS